MRNIDLLWRSATAVYLSSVSGLVLAGALAPSALSREAGTLLAIGVLLGVPHGAFDHLVPGWLDGTGRVRGVRWALPYVIAVGSALAAEAVAPLPTVGVLVVLSAYHFADGEAGAVALRARRQRDRLDSCTGWATSTAMLAVPALAQREAVQRLARTVLQIGLPLPHGTARVVLLAAGVGWVVGVAVVCVLRRRRLPAIELVLLAVASVVASPGAVFAVAFVAGHSLRHGVRLAQLRAGEHSGDLVRTVPSRIPGAHGGPAGAISWAVPLAATLVAGAVALAVVGVGLVQVAVAGVLALSVPHALVARSMAGQGPAPAGARAEGPATSTRGRGPTPRGGPGSCLPVGGVERRPRSARRGVGRA